MISAATVGDHHDVIIAATHAHLDYRTCLEMLVDNGQILWLR